MSFGAVAQHSHRVGSPSSVTSQTAESFRRLPRNTVCHCSSRESDQHLNMIQLDLGNIFHFLSLREAGSELGAACFKDVDARQRLGSSSHCRCFNAVRLPERLTGILLLHDVRDHFALKTTG